MINKIKSIIASGENISVEFKKCKKDLPKNVFVTICAFLNRNGNKAHGHGIIDINDFVPFPKNPSIAGIFKEIGWADELGSGIRNIKHYAKIYSKSEPVFIEGDVFKTTIKLKTDDKKPIKADRKQEIILSYLNENEYLTNKIARELLGLAESTTKRILNEMVDNNMLTIEGEYKNRIYKLKE